VEFDRLVNAALSDLSASQYQSCSTEDQKKDKDKDKDKKGKESAKEKGNDNEAGDRSRSRNSTAASEHEGSGDTRDENTTSQDASVEQLLNSPDAAKKLLGLSRYLGVAVLRKSSQDMVSDGRIVVRIEEDGSPRRCGGQGDILSGCLGIAYSWAEKVPIQSEGSC
jgi:hypothetical protein